MASWKRWEHHCCLCTRDPQRVGEGTLIASTTSSDRIPCQYQHGRPLGIATFHSGRGIYLRAIPAGTSVWLIIVSVPATLNIAKAKDSQGNDIEIEGSYTDGAIRSVFPSKMTYIGLILVRIATPHPFPCSITPRSPNIHELVNSDE
ncbi:hypothetical protein BD779DRAFT_350717 [Infundibulicybe gibba]|nr:hypothetical protein BD779DRAFT_350717 [Infundibulicybe gibba]